MPLCPTCGTNNESFAVYCQSCGNALETTAPQGDSGGTSYAGFWKRVLAWLIDSLVVSAAIGIIAAITLGAGFAAFFVGHWLYEAFMTSSSWQATLGKRVVNMTVTDLDGRRISFGRATGRHFAKWLSAMVLGIGFLIVGFTAKKQGLHDMIASTLVVQR